MKQISRTFRAVAILAMAALLTGSCGNRKKAAQPAAEPVPEVTEAAETPAETYFHAIDKYFTETIASQYAPAQISLSYHDYAAADESNPDDIQVWGDFWVENYDVSGDTLKFVSGGNHSGKMHVRQDPEGRFTVLSMDAVGDGSQYLPTAKAIFGDKFEDFQRAHSDEKEREKIRGNVISEYVRTHGLNVHFYQDYGWPAVRIPTPDNR